MQKKKPSDREGKNKTGTNVRRLLDYFTFEDNKLVFCRFFLNVCEIHRPLHKDSTLKKS